MKVLLLLLLLFLLFIIFIIIFISYFHRLFSAEDNLFFRYHGVKHYVDSCHHNIWHRCFNHCGTKPARHHCHLERPLEKTAERLYLSVGAFVHL